MNRRAGVTCEQACRGEPLRPRHGLQSLERCVGVNDELGARRWALPHVWYTGDGLASGEARGSWRLAGSGTRRPGGGGDCVSGKGAGGL